MRYNNDVIHYRALDFPDDSTRAHIWSIWSKRLWQQRNQWSVAVAKSPDADNWLNYFASIRAVCPWSLPAYTRGEIDIVRGARIRALGNFRARVYQLNNYSPRRIKRLATELENRDDLQEYEWLWSHPRYGQHSAPIGCIIQQNRAELAEIRSKYASEKSNRP